MYSLFYLIVQLCEIRVKRLHGYNNVMHILYAIVIYLST